MSNLDNLVPRQFYGQLLSFVAVADTLSFRAAGENLGRSQPAVTAQVRQLELLLGTRLFDRTTRNVRLTGAGEHLLQGARRILNQSGRLIAELRTFDERPIGQVSISFSPTIAAMLASGVLDRLGSQDSASGLRVMIREDLGSEMFAAIRSGEADFGLGPYVEVPNDLDFQPAFRQQFFLIVHRAHPLVERGQARLSDLDDEPLLCSAPGSTARSVLDHALSMTSRVARPQYEALQYPTLYSLASARLGVTVMPRAHPGLLSALNLVALPFEDVNLSRIIGFIRRRDDQSSPAIERMVELVREIATGSDLIEIEAA